MADERFNGASAAGIVDIADPTLYRAEVPESEWKALRAFGRPVHFDGDPPHWAVT